MASCYTIRDSPKAQPMIDFQVHSSSWLDEGTTGVLPGSDHGRIYRIPAFVGERDLHTLRDDALNSVRFRDDASSLAAKASTLVPADALAPRGPIRRLFENPEFLALICRVTGQSLVRMVDDIADAPLNIMPPGTEMDWHTDFVDVSASLLLQSCEGGGEFQVRSAAGEPERTITFTEGDLLIFAGGETQHRITRVVGDRPRMAALFGFVLDGSRKLPRDKRIAVFGR